MTNEAAVEKIAEALSEHHKIDDWYWCLDAARVAVGALGIEPYSLTWRRATLPPLYRLRGLE